MIDETNKIIYVDFSTLARFGACKEKERLGGVLAYRLRRQKSSLSFGHALHAGIGAYYNALAGGWFDAGRVWHVFDEMQLERSPLEHAKLAFLQDLKYTGAELPIEATPEERRSVTRGLGLLEAYVYRWRNEHYENVIVDDKPFVEFGFRYPLSSFEGYTVMYVGYIDRVMRNTQTGHAVVFETKTTTQALSMYILSAKPNPQVTGYFPPIIDIVGSTMEAVWDCIYVSDRAPNTELASRSAAHRFWMYGIDVEKDFRRQTTSRSARDISEFKIDAEESALEYCRWLTSSKTRWPRSGAPKECNSYGGCAFRPRCAMNLDPEEEPGFMEGLDFIQQEWAPWKTIVAEELRERERIA